ncbi:hypothetical protein C5167_048037 [Papaver somniferum]|uniref:Uncharacterized protein n=1 Tax=Papaver somniferum TaxID=3469 RepID=A0A4Y7KKS9_PAPSO|nr:hypothetical protein C5167_048037 [Papaver somniferum]
MVQFTFRFRLTILMRYEGIIGSSRRFTNLTGFQKGIVRNDMEWLMQFSGMKFAVGYEVCGGSDRAAPTKCLQNEEKMGSHFPDYYVV